jgi:hypothetical protein
VAQNNIKLHGHPQLAEYATPADWPTLDCQGWFGDPDPLMAGHIHIVPKLPVYGEITDLLLDVPFTLKAHMVPGIVGGLSGPQLKSIVWADTGSTTQPILRGDPNGLKEWAGVATFDFSLQPPGDFLNIFKFPDHGWAQLRIFSRTALDNGDAFDMIATAAVYSLLDPNAPIKPPIEQGNPGVFIRSAVTVWRPDQGGIVGEMITEVNDYIPLLPINAPWTTISQGYNYTAPLTTEPRERFEQRLDPDLHHGVRGSLQRGIDIGEGQNRSFFGNIVIDPTTMGTGAHKEMVVWTQPFGAESFSSVIVFPTLVGDGVPVPLLIPVPNVVGQSETDAAAAIAAVGLTVGTPFARVSDPVIPVDQVLKQAPSAGTTVVKGSPVMLTLSNGPAAPPAQVWVPAVPTFMQLHVNGVATARWQICDDPMVTCVELVTLPEDDSIPAAPVSDMPGMK